MSTINKEDLLAQLNWRCAVKKFDATKKVPQDVWNALEQAIVLSPSSYGLQPWRVLVVTDTALRIKLREHAYNQAQVTDCSHFAVLSVKTSMTPGDIDEYIARIAKVRNIAPDKLVDFKNMMLGDLVNGPRSKMITEWASRQAYIALGNLLTSAALVGVDACPMEGIDPPAFNEVLKLNSKGLTAVVACAVGYRASDDAYAKLPKVRFDREKLIVRIQ